MTTTTDQWHQMFQLLRGPSCPLTVGSAKVKRERKSGRRVKSGNPGRGGGSKSVSCEKSKRSKEQCRGQGRKILSCASAALWCSLSSPFFVSSLLLGGALQTEALFSKAMTFFDLDSNQYSEVVLARKRPLWNHRGYYIRSGRFSHTGKDKYEIMG